MSFPVTSVIPSEPPCKSFIWGHGVMLDTIQRARIFNDSKKLVDMKLLHSPIEVFITFQRLQVEKPDLDRDDLNSFIEENFSLTLGQEFENWDPEDWQPEPEYLKDLNQKSLVYAGLEINKLWKFLSRKCSADLKENPHLFSKIWLPHGFVMPGGRFREIYYWDTYWIMRGMLLSGMKETVKGMLENFIYQIKEFGHIPNGTRKYYINRTQPPFLISMVSKYLEATEDFDFLKSNWEALEKEMRYFEANRSRKYTWNGSEHRVFFYSSDCYGPRPESYIEDMEIAEELFETEREKKEFYMHIMAAAESGWDFSSRWFIDSDGGNTGTLANAKTCFILPVDLNALMYKNYVHLTDFFKIVGDPLREKQNREKAEAMSNTINEVFWDDKEKMWFDVDTINNCRRKRFYASNLFPIWAEAYPQDEKQQYGDFAVDYLLRTGATELPGGIPASFMHSGQQWDWNAWPPLQHLIVSGLNKTGSLAAKQLAFSIAKKYTLSTISSCNKASDMCKFFEKYDPTKPGTAGGGGEYVVQIGFGWTNGVLIDFITTYGDDLIESDEYIPKKTLGTYGLKKKVKYSKTEPEDKTENPSIPTPS